MTEPAATQISLTPLFEVALPHMRHFLTSKSDYRADLIVIGPDNPLEPRWNQDWFPRFDSLAAYVVVRRAQPARIIEVGAGHSTRFLARAIRDGNLPTRLTSIDPQPRAKLSGFDVLTKLLQDLPLSFFGSLTLGEIIFVDSSHVLAPGSDVERLLEHILALLPSRILVYC